MERGASRIASMHFKGEGPWVKADVIGKRSGCEVAGGQGVCCTLGDGDVDFSAVRQVLLDAGFEGWCTVEQDCDPLLDPDPVGDARKNRGYLSAIGFQ